MRKLSAIHAARSPRRLFPDVQLMVVMRQNEGNYQKIRMTPIT